MSARIIDLAEARAQRSRSVEGEPQAPGLADRFHFWTGASGTRYVHTIYKLVDCPELANGNYILVKRDSEGVRHVLAVGRLSNDAESLNLAQVRQRGAELGANEVHVHLLAESSSQTKVVEFDLREGQLEGSPVSPTLH